MLNLIKYNVIVKLRNFDTLFWPLIFPLILGTLFYFGFGNMEEANFETVPVAVVEVSGGDRVFLEFIENMEADAAGMVDVQKMTEEEAEKALKAQEVSGIYYAGPEPSLTVGGNGLSQSILQSLLESYVNGKAAMEKVAAVHPEGIQAAAAQMGDYQEAVEQVSLGGKTTDGMIQFFYALIAMACLYGAFIGFGAVLSFQANLTPLAARRCITPTHKLKIIFSEMAGAFMMHFLNVIILLVYLRYVLHLDFQGNLSEMLVIILFGCIIGVSMGIFIGSIGKMGEGIKIAILLAVSMTSSFLAGLMNGTMKDIVERNMPFMNRINPASVIADAFYCINVYGDRDRYMRSLVTLVVMSVGMLGASFLMVRRERYDSI